MNALSTVIGVLVRRLNRHLGIGQRYGIRFANGNRERNGFTSRVDAEIAGQKTGVPFVCFSYTPIDLRARPDASPSRERFTGDSDAPVARRSV